MYRVTLIQLRGNISYTFPGIGGIGSKYNPTIVSISYQIRESTLLSDEVPWSTIINKPDSHKIWRRGLIQDNFILSEATFDFPYLGFLAFSEESAISLMTCITCHSFDHWRCPWNDCYLHQEMCLCHSDTPSHNGRTYCNQGICLSFHP